jgi:hypothetical protein
LSQSVGALCWILLGLVKNSLHVRLSETVVRPIEFSL